MPGRKRANAQPVAEKEVEATEVDSRGSDRRRHRLLRGHDEREQELGVAGAGALVGAYGVPSGVGEALAGGGVGQEGAEDRAEAIACGASDAACLLEGRDNLSEVGDCRA